MKNIYFFLIFALSLSFVNAQNRIKIYGVTNDAEVTPVEILPTEASNIPNTYDDTHFGAVPVGIEVEHVFDIENTTGAQFRIVDADVLSSNAAFKIKLNPAGQVKPGRGRNDLTVTFTAQDDFLSEAIITLRIENEETYTFKVAGNTIKAVGAVMISQYYNDSTDEIIEITNLSDIEIGAGFISDSISGGVRRPLGSIPISGTITVDASGANGNAYHLIRSADGEILDVIGNNTSLGSNTSFTKGSCATEEPHTTFNVNDWIQLTIDEVVNARPEQNISLGIYNFGPRILDNNAWSAGDFDRTRSVEIINSDIVTQDFLDLYEMCDLTIDGTSTVNYIDTSTSSTVAVYRDLYITGEFTIGDTESLVMYDNFATIEGEIIKIENSAEKVLVNDATYWSSPVEGAVLTTVFPDADTNRMFLLNPQQTNDIYETNYPKYEHWFNHTGAMITGQGYSVEGDIGTYPDTQTISFTGIPHNGFYYIDVYEGISSDILQENRNSNLIGNPYPSAIDASLFISVNNGGQFSGTIYIWSQRTDNIVGGVYQDPGYFHYNLTGGVGETTDPIPDGVNYKIASGQGFMIDVENTSVITFNNEMRVVGENTMFYKSENSKKSNSSAGERNRMWLRMTNQEDKVSEQLIGFFSKASDVVDYGYDGRTFNDSDYNFYSLIENNKYTIQGLGDFNTDKTIDLGFDSNEAGDFKISISKTEGVLKDQEIYLVDNVLNITYDLKKGDYKFTQTETGEFSNRFTLQFASSALDVDEFTNQENNLIISNDNDFIKISANQNVKSVEVYDMLGRMILNSKPNKQSFNLSVNTVNKGSILVIQAQLENGTMVSKKMIKH